MSRKLKPNEYGLLEGFLSRRRSAQANKLIPPEHRSERILDIGSGPNPFFLLNTSFSEKYGLDRRVFEDPHEELRDRKLVLISHDIKKKKTLPFKDEFFSVVTMLAVIEHIELFEVPPLLIEIRRVLRPGGICIITTPCPWTDGLLRFMATARLVSPNQLNEHKQALSGDMMISVLQQAGFLRAEIRSGYFELFMNSWVKARK
ncbi:class I SAM-dependent methyltransferase [Candidatus Hydrogenedentota bacterium]